MKRRSTRRKFVRPFGPQFSPYIRGVPLAPPLDPPLLFSRPFRRVEFQFPKVCDSKRQHTYSFQTKQSKVYRILKVRGGTFFLIKLNLPLVTPGKMKPFRTTDFLLIKVFIFLWYRYIVTSDIVHFMFDEHKI